MLQKTSMKITRIIIHERYLQLQESKPNMTELEDNLKKIVRTEGKFDIISKDIFDQTETKNNQMIQKQNKKLEKGSCYCGEQQQ
jgi:hypothetical protein